MKPNKADAPGRLDAGNTRESILDDTIRYALIGKMVVVEREGLATT